MAYYCIVTDVTIEDRSAINVAWELRDDAPEPDEVEASGVISFIIIEGESAASLAQRLQDQIEAAFRRQVDRANLVGVRAEKLKQRLVGRRYPPLP